MSGGAKNVKKGDIFAIPIKEKNGYIYMYAITGNQYGHVVVVYDYFTHEIEKNTDKILGQKTLYKQSPIIAFIEPYEEDCILVGNKKPNWDDWKEPIYSRESIKANFFDIKHYDRCKERAFQCQYEALQEGIKHKFDDWDLNKYEIVGKRGKLDVTDELEVGELTPKQRDIFVGVIFPHEEDFIHKYLFGYDRNTVLCDLFI